MLLRASALLIGGACLLLAACDSGSNYDTDGADDDYDLQNMTLRNEDLPEGVQIVNAAEFTNDEWAQAFDTGDPDAKRNQLDAQGQIRNYIAFFTWENPAQYLGRFISITTHSTLFTDDASASEAERKSVCGLLVADADPVDEFNVPKIGDDAVGFFVTTPDFAVAITEDVSVNFGTSVDTAVCFRTGRILHAVVQTGLDGTQDVGLSMNLAKRMLDRVEAVIDGTADPYPEPEVADEDG